ncbi:MAG: hypothetical protein GXY23_10780 [Myxococcales bacterium]|jgi:tetratricopeptide (TPR) repeat protein|nr:hypothetical protein [Myxococcales bacterium]
MHRERFHLKRLTREGVKGALAKAERYRLLNQPEAAESICLDVLDVDPTNQEALDMLIVTLSDQLGNESPGLARRALELTQLVEDDYRRHYLRGLVHEREGRAALRRAMGAHAAYECFREAMEQFERAEAIRPPGVDDPILRWNSCVRIIQREGLRPEPHQAEFQLE